MTYKVQKFHIEKDIDAAELERYLDDLHRRGQNDQKVRRNDARD